MQIDNVRDGRYGRINSWQVEPLVYDHLSDQHIGRTVIYRDHGRAEAGTLTSWRDGVVFARYSRGDTAAGADPQNLMLACTWQGGPTEAHPERAYCKPDQSCCDFICGN